MKTERCEGCDGLGVAPVFLLTAAFIVAASAGEQDKAPIGYMKAPCPDCRGSGVKRS